jgi:hypothetical protein
MDDGRLDTYSFASSGTSCRCIGLGGGAAGKSSSHAVGGRRTDGWSTWSTSKSDDITFWHLQVRNPCRSRLLL